MWSRIPLLRLILPYILGILLSEHAGPVAVMDVKIFSLSGGAVILLSLLYSLLFGFHLRWIYGMWIILFMLITGFFFSNRHVMDGQACLARITDTTTFYIGVIDEGFMMRERSCRGTVKLMGYTDSAGMHALNARVMVYTDPDSLLPEAGEGSMILFRASLKPIRAPANPSEFNFKQYLSRRVVYHSTFLKKGEWHLIEGKNGFSLMHYADALRKYLLDKLYVNGVHDRKLGVSAALLLGDDSHLADEVREIYSRAGAMHILCVSGLHVGVIFLILTTVLGFLRRLALGRFILPAMLLLSIWAYALITGLAPPVVRASSMISFIIVGNAIGRQRNVYNTLAAAALLMLMIDPFAYFGAGFRLSYAAVLGIVILQKPVYNLIYFKYYLPDRIWAITAVSIAAQLGTLPLVLYYFHQFPVYSLLTNLIVIPLSSLIIYAGLLLFILPSLTGAATMVALALSAFIGLMDTGVGIIESLPFAAITDVSIDLTAMGIIYLLIVSAILYFLSRKNTYLLLALGLFLGYSAYSLYRNHGTLNQQTFVVYAVRGHSAYDIISGREHTFIADSALSSDEAKIGYSIRPNWLDKGLNPPRFVMLEGADRESVRGTCTIIKVHGKRAAIWEGRFPACEAPDQRLGLDYLLLRGPCPFSLDDVLRWFRPGTIILDTSIPPWKKEKLKADAAEIQIWDVAEQGAFIHGQ